MKRGTLVTVRMPRGPLRQGTYFKAHMTLKGEWYEIKPLEKGSPTFRARPSCVTTN